MYRRDYASLPESTAFSLTGVVTSRPVPSRLVRRRDRYYGTSFTPRLLLQIAFADTFGALPQEISVFSDLPRNLPGLGGNKPSRPKLKLIRRCRKHEGHPRLYLICPLAVETYGFYSPRGGSWAAPARETAVKK